MPAVIDIYEGSNGLIVMEEYIEGDTVAEMLEKNCLPEKILCPERKRKERAWIFTAFSFDSL